MTRKQLVSVIGMLVFAVLVAGCAPVAVVAPEFKASFDSKELVVPSGQVVTVSVIVEGGVGPLHYDWDWSGPQGMGVGGNSPTFQVTPPQDLSGSSNYVIKVRVRDVYGQVATAEKEVIVGSPLTPTPECDSNHSCDSGKHCENGICVDDNTPPPSECRLNSDCEAGRHCQDGTCVKDTPPPSECRLNSDCGSGKHCDNGKCVKDTPPPSECTSDGNCGSNRHCDQSCGCCQDNPSPSNPAIDLKVNGQDGPLTFAADESGDSPTLGVSWTSSGAVLVDVSGAPNFTGHRALKTYVDELVTLKVGTWPLKAIATGNSGTTTASDTVTVTVTPFVPPVSNLLKITGVTVSPPFPRCVGDKTTFTVHHTGSGTIHWRSPTTTVTGSKTAEADGDTDIDYIWPFTVGCINLSDDCSSKFWPDGRDSLPDIFLIPTKVNKR